MTFIEGKSGEIIAVCWGAYQGQPMCTMTPTLYMLAAVAIISLFVGLHFALRRFF